MRVHPKRAHILAGKSVLLVDDVMTSGATLAAATEAVRAGGAENVSIAVLARVVKDA
jgi:predicted amidophosphoribosyltransferase